MLPRDNATWCEEYTSVGATGDGTCDNCYACRGFCNENCSTNACYDCHMKGKRYTFGNSASIFGVILALKERPRYII